MKIIVPIKRVIDANIKVRVKSDGSGVETANVKMAMNPFCEIAVEQAVRMKEAGQAEEIIAVSIGGDQAQETLRTALAMGADRALHVEADNAIEPLNVAKILKVLVVREDAQLVLLGKQAVDGDNNQTPQMLAALLGWAQGTFVSGIELDGSTLTVTREVDTGLEILSIPLPAIISTDLRLNEPRYASLPNIMKARKKPLETATPDDLGVDASTRLTVLNVTEPEARNAGVKVADVAELVDKLKNEAKVI